MNSAFFLHDPTYMQECFVTSEPYAIEQKGEKVRTLLVADSGFDPYRVVATNEAYLNAHKDVVKAFVDASIAGWKDYLVDPATTDAEIKKENKEMTQGQLDYSRNMLKADRIVEGDPAKGEAVGQMNMDRITAQYKILRSLDIIPEFDYKKTFDNEFCAPPAATASATPAPHP
jgi:NitT/TauT family transport system substrate-binding protein